MEEPLKKCVESGAGLETCIYKCLAVGDTGICGYICRFKGTCALQRPQIIGDIKPLEPMKPNNVTENPDSISSGNIDNKMYWGWCSNCGRDTEHNSNRICQVCGLYMQLD